MQELETRKAELERRLELLARKRAIEAKLAKGEAEPTPEPPATPPRWQRRQKQRTQKTPKHQAKLAGMHFPVAVDLSTLPMKFGPDSKARRCRCGFLTVSSEPGKADAALSDHIKESRQVKADS